MNNEKPTKPMEKPGLRILILEDISRDADLIQRELKRGGIKGEFLVLDGREEFLRALEGFGPDIILSDYSMPRFTGLDALELVQKKRIDIPFVIVTGSINEETAVECMKLGADDYVLKENLQRLPRVVEAVLEKKRLQGIEEQARRAREQAAREWMTTFDAVNDSLVLLNLGGVIKRCNRAFQALVDQSFKEIIGRPLEEMLDSADQETIARLCTDVRNFGIRKSVVVAFRQRKFWMRLDPLVVAEELRGFVGTLSDITHQLKKEEELNRLIREWNVTFDATSDGICLLDREQRIRRCNRAMSQIAGKEKKAMEGVHCWEIVHGTQAPPPDCPFLKGGRSLRRETAAIQQDGRWFEVTVDPIIDADGVWQGAVHNLRDITERRQAAEDLRLSEENFRFLAENMGDMVWTVDLDLQTTYVSPSIEKILGFTVEERKRQSLEQMFPSSTLGQIRGLFAEEYRKVLAGETDPGKTVIAEMEYLCRDGSTLWVENSLKWILDQQGNLSGILGVSRNISERKRAEEALRQSEERFRSIFNQAAVGMAQVALDGRWLDVNQRLCDILGYNREEVLGLSFQEITHPEDLEDSLTQVRRLLAGEIKNYHLEKRYIHKKARIIWINLTVGLVRTTTGIPDYFVSVIEDITERKEMEKKIQKSEFRYRRLYESMTDAYVKVDMAGRILEYNKAYRQMLGYSDEELRTLTYLEITPEKWHNLERRMVKDQILVRGDSDLYEKEYRCKDGRVFPVELRTYLVRDEAGEPEAMWAIIRDISERKRVEKEHQLLISAIEQSAETVVITDAQGTIQYVNPAFAAVSGYDREDALRQNPRILKSGRQDEAFYRDLWDTISGGRTWAGRMVNRRKDGSLYTEDATISPVFDDSGEIINFVAVKRDVSEHLQLSREKEELQAQFLQAQKMESIGRLAGGVAHDFNNLLSVINGYSELALDRIDEGDPLRAEIQEIRRAGGRAAALTRQLLAFSRRQILSSEVFNLNDNIIGLEKMLRRLIGEDVVFKMNLASDLWLVEADMGQMEQVLMNLVVNARDAMPQGGALEISTRNVLVDDTMAGQHVSPVPGPYILLTVADTGIGIDSETRQHIFEPFFTTKEKDRGTGLGLSTVYGIVKQSGGHIEVSSRPGQGSTFGIFLPRTGDDGTALVGVVKKETTPGGNETILVVEDEKSLGLLAKKILVRAGYRVLNAADGPEALEMIDRLAEPIHLLLTDVVLPKISGPELADILCARIPGLKVVYMSGYAPETLTHHLKSREGIAFVDKPFDRVALLEQVRKTLG